MKTFLKFILSLFMTFSLFSCENSSDSESDKGAVLRIVFHHLYEGDILAYNQEYRNASGNRFVIEEFKAYLSNIKLRNRSAGTFWLESESYHLLSPEGDKMTFELNVSGIPAGTYDQLEISVGVDNAKNYSLDNIGALDPSNNMAWDWNTGYKFLLLEGRYFPDSADSDRGLIYHIGSDRNYRTMRFSFRENGNPVFSEGGITELHFDVEISELFNSPNVIDFSEHNVVMFEDISVKVADNYADGFLKIRN